MSTDVDVFRFNGKRYAVSYASIKFDNYDPGYRQLQTGTITVSAHTSAPVFHKVYKRIHNNVLTKKLYARGRKGVMVIVRSAYTGVPYSGVALISPDDKSNAVARWAAQRLAAKRAIYSIASALHAEYAASVYNKNLKSSRSDQKPIMDFHQYANAFWAAYRKMLYDKSSASAPTTLLPKSTVEKLNGIAKKQKLPIDNVYHPTEEMQSPTL